MKFHLEALPEKLFDALRQTAPTLRRMGFYLAGGTALAIYLGHRQSVDLDWFTGEQLDDPLRLAQRLRDSGIDFVTSQTAPSTLHGSLLSVRMSLFEYRYPLLRHPVVWEEGGAAKPISPKVRNR